MRCFGRRKTAEKRVQVRLFHASSLYCYSRCDRGCDSTDRNSLERVVVALEETDAAAASQACNLRCKLSGIFRCTNLPQKEAGF